jgi:hypothetical protein
MSRLSRFVLVLAGLVIAALVWASPAGAHQTGVSQGRYEVRGARLDGHVVLANAELANALPALDTDRDGALSANEVDQGRALLEREMVGRLRISADGAACPATLRSTSLTERDGVDLGFDASCPARSSRWAVQCGFLEVLPAGHRHLARLSAGASGAAHEEVALLGAMDLTLDASGAPSDAGTFGALVRLGITHILTGYDHLVFLLGLVVLGGRARSLLLALTAFTAAHSISLALATLGVWAPSPAVVEPAIALSIAYVGVENLRRMRRAGGADAPNADAAHGRWPMTFAFGLVHGFGFAGALAEIGLPRASVPAALLAFNVGVEIGQIAVVALVLPLLAWARHARLGGERGVRWLNVAIIGAGLVWFAARIAA